MPRRDDVCPGPCGRRYREAWAAHEKAVARWEVEMAHWEAEMAARVAVVAAGNLPNAPGGFVSNPELPGTQDAPERPPEPDIEPTLGTPIWCQRCTSLIRSALTEIDQLACLLDAWSDGQRGAPSGQPVSRRAASSGTPSPVAIILDTLYSEVTDLEDAWRRRRGYLTVRRGKGRGAHGRSMALAFIRQYLVDILTVAENVEFGTRALKWQRLLHSMTKTDPVVRRRPGRCPGSGPHARCGLVKTMFVGDDGITKCRACGRWMSEREYQEEVLGVVDAGVVAESREREGDSR